MDAGVIGCWRQVLEGCQIPRHALANRLVVTARPLGKPAATTLDQLLVQRREARRPRYRHQQVPADPADQPFDPGLRWGRLLPLSFPLPGRPNRSANAARCPRPGERALTEPVAGAAPHSLQPAEPTALMTEFANTESQTEPAGPRLLCKCVAMRDLVKLVAGGDYLHRAV